jgi:protein phosphatase
MLYVMCGIPASGKSTHAATIECDEVLSADIVRKVRGKLDLHQVGALRMLAPPRLRAGESLVIDACNTKQSERLSWLDAARWSLSDSHLIVMRTPLDVCRERNAERGAQAVPDTVLVAQHDRMTRIEETIRQEPWSLVTFVDY